MTTTSNPNTTAQDSAFTPSVAIYVEWAGRTFGPYPSIEEAQRHFEFGQWPTVAVAPDSKVTPARRLSESTPVQVCVLATHGALTSHHAPLRAS